MPDIEDDGLDEAFKGFGEEPAQPKPPVAVDPVDPVTPPAPAPEVPKVEEPKPDDKPAEPKKPAEDAKKDEETPPAPAPEAKPEEGAKPPETPETPVVETPAEEAKPLTKEDVTSIIKDIRTEERTSGQALQGATQEVLDAYYPEGLTNTLVDQNTGKELRTPQDVVDAYPDMPIEEAAQWLTNAQFKRDKDVRDIKDEASKIADTTLAFKRDSVAAIQKYEPLFKKYPHLQDKAFNLMMKQVKADVKKNVILEAPDVLDLYDTYLEPWQLAFEHATQTSATNPVPPTPAPEAPKPGADDRLDEPGDGGTSPVNDPTDFAQQVTKELAKGI